MQVMTALHHHHHTNIISVVQRTASRTLNKIKKQRDANATVWQSRHGPRKEVRF